METIIMKIILIIIAIGGIYCIFKKKDKHELILNNVFWLVISWMFALGLYFFSGIKYTFNLNILSFGYIFLFWGVFLLGQYTSKFIFKHKAKEEKNTENIDFSKKINLLPLFIVSVISVIVYSIYIISINNIQLGVTRNINTNGFATLFLILSNSSLVIWLYELAYSLLNQKRVSWYGIISVIVYNIPGIIISGRDALMIFFVATTIMLIYCLSYAKKNGKLDLKKYKNIIKYIGIALIMIVIYLIFLSSNRYGENASETLELFRGCAGCEFPQYLEDIYYKLGGLGKLIINVVFYYSSQISKLGLMFEQYEGPYLLGLYQLHYVSRLLPESWNLDFSIVSNKIAEITSNNGVPGFKVFWETTIGYSIYDFGRIGSLIISFACGILTGMVNILCKYNINVLKIVLKVFICVAMFLTIELSPLFDYYYVFPLFWLLMVFGWSYRKNKLKDKKREK